jgi:NAD/NADP transhydrogenase alpha subunit
MRIAVQAETDANESRVAATPDTAKALIALGADVAVEAGAGRKSAILDEAYARMPGSFACMDDRALCRVNARGGNPAAFTRRSPRAP